MPNTPAPLDVRPGRSSGGAPAAGASFRVAQDGDRVHDPVLAVEGLNVF